MDSRYREKVVALRRKRQELKRRNRRKLLLFGAVLLFVAIIAVCCNLAKSNNDDPENDRFGSKLNPKPENPSEISEIIIVIDPGHGGIDPGTVHGGYLEKDLNLHLALLVKDYLEAQGFQVVLTREDDSAVTFADRRLLAEEVNADAFVSIHHNALANDTVTEGIETWYNDKKNPLNEILAMYIQNEASSAANAKNRGLRPSERMLTLQEITMPSCLIEVGFLSSDSERLLLTDLEYQDKLSLGIANGIVEYFNAGR